MLNYPRVFFLFSFCILWLAAWIGTAARKRRLLRDEERDDFGVVQTATLTLLGLIIGFSFSMATVATISARRRRGRGQRDRHGVRSGGLLPSADAEGASLLRRYIDDLRI